MKKKINSVNFYLTLVFALAALSLPSKIFPEILPLPDTVWHDAKNLTIEGRGWGNSEMEMFYDRLPAKAKQMVRPPVWDLARNSAGLHFRFISDADSFFVRWTLTSATLSMGHMPATGVSGIDLYYKKNGSWFYMGTGRAAALTNTAKFFKPDSSSKEVEYLLNLPLYNGVSALNIGMDNKSLLKDAPLDRNIKPILFYGTSITQGGCASRPGLAFTSIISRKISRPVINLGFSGNGHMDVELAELISETDAALYVIDCMRNLTTEQLKTRTEPFIKILRKAKPNAPVLLLDQTDYKMKFPNERSRYLYEVYEKLLKAGDKNIYFLEGNNLLGSDGEGTVDGIHPNDLGFSRMADVIQKKIEEIIK